MRRVMLIAGLALACGHAFADDMFPPPWRGQPGTVTAGWDFWGAEGPGPRSILPGFYSANPGGLPDLKALASIDSNVYAHNALFGRQSVLEIGPNGLPGDLGFGLRNYAGYTQLKVRAQITYYQGFGTPMDFGIGGIPDDPPWQWPDFIDAVASETYVHTDGWVTAMYEYTLDSSPTFHGFGVIFTEYPAYVDQVWIDTLAIPSPAGLALLSLAGWTASARRRERPTG